MNYYYSQKAADLYGYNIVSHEGKEYKYTGMYNEMDKGDYKWEDKVLVLKCEEKAKITYYGIKDLDYY